jgi:hypothetical protein
MARDETIRLEDAEMTDHCRTRETQGSYEILDGLATPDAHQFNDTATRFLHHVVVPYFIMTRGRFKYDNPYG